MNDRIKFKSDTYRVCPTKLIRSGVNTYIPLKGYICVTARSMSAESDTVKSDTAEVRRVSGVQTREMAAVDWATSDPLGEWVGMEAG